MLAPAPAISVHDRPFWDAASEGKLLLQRCIATGRLQYYPRGHSLATSGQDLDWVESAGRGTLYTFSVVARSFYENLPAPYVLAIVDLDEGVRMTAHIVDIDPVEVIIGMRLKIDFMARGDGPPIPVFRSDPA